MFGLSMWEIGLILAVALVVLGPKKLPELARKLGEGLREFRNATDSFKATVNGEMNKPPQAPADSAPNAAATSSEPAQLPAGEELAQLEEDLLKKAEAAPPAEAADDATAPSDDPAANETVEPEATPAKDGTNG